jgi:hypothetical protein
MLRRAPPMSHLIGRISCADLPAQWPRGYLFCGANLTVAALISEQFLGNFGDIKTGLKLSYSKFSCGLIFLIRLPIIIKLLMAKHYY